MPYIGANDMPCNGATDAYPRVPDAVDSGAAWVWAAVIQHD